MAKRSWYRQITQRDLLDEFAAIMSGVERGESYTITRNGTPMGRLIPLRHRAYAPCAEVLAAFAAAPVLDAERFRRDIDSVANPEPFDRDW